jgi:hypothetical protein
LFHRHCSQNRTQLQQTITKNENATAKKAAQSDCYAFSATYLSGVQGNDILQVIQNDMERE